MSYVSIPRLGAARRSLMDQGWLRPAGLVLFWALELLLLQELTAALPGDLMPAVDSIKYAARRMLLNLAACAVLVCLLNRLCLYVVFVTQLIAAFVLLVYADYFEAPLSWFTVQAQWREGAAVAGFGWTLIPWKTALLFVLALPVKIALREWATRNLPWQVHRWRVVGWAAGIYVVFALGLAVWHKPITKLRLASPEYTYGYVVAWLCEGLYYDQRGLLDLALSRAAQRSDRLVSHMEPLILGDHVAIIQVESLDFDVLDARVEGKMVMPFLHRLRESSLYFAVEPIHDTGSSDADFTVLTGVRPNGRIAPYKVRNFPYTNTLPQLAQAAGYYTVALHGYSGNFFARKPAYRQMGFAEIVFAEDLARMGWPLVHGAVDDHDILGWSASRLRESRNRAMHFVITYTSHGPFDRVPAGRRNLFPRQRGKLQGYLNSMRYLDGALADYIEALPPRAIVIIYGDHASGVRGYMPAGEGAGARVPWIIYRKGENLAISQPAKTRPGGSASPPVFSMLDLAGYLHVSLRKCSTNHSIAVPGIVGPEGDADHRTP